jgi:hypothetical protein
MRRRYSCLYTVYGMFCRERLLCIFFRRFLIYTNMYFFVFILSNISQNGAHLLVFFPGLYLLFCIKVCTY